MIDQVSTPASSNRPEAGTSKPQTKSFAQSDQTIKGSSMEPVCQACGYQRKPTDQAPDWEYPSCGKAYVKTSHSSPSPLVIYPDNPPTEQGNQLHGTPSYRTPSKETPLNKHGILIGTLFALFLVFGIPILTNPSSASDIVFHSDAGFIALILIVLVAVAAVIKRVHAKIDLNDRKSVFVLYAAFPGLIFAVLFLGLTISTHNEVHTAIRIQRNGQRTTANVVRIYTGSCGRRSCSINVEYTFTPSTETSVTSKPIHGYADLGDRSDAPHVIYARTNKQVPIAYEVDHPEVSALNFDDDIFRLDPNERYRGTLALLGKLFLGAWVLMLAVVGLSLWLSPAKKPNAD